MSKKHCLTGKVLAGVTLGMCCAGLSAQQFDRDIQLAQKLNEINLQDYAQNLIDGLLEKNKDNLELRAQQAQNFVVQGKMDEATKIIDSLPKNSPAYFDAQAGIGMFYVRQRKFAEGIPMLALVKEYAVQNNLINKYQMPLAWLLTAYQDQGKAAEAQELLGILARAEEGNTERSEREMKLAQARYGLSCIENMKETFNEKYKALKDEYNTKWKTASQNIATKGALGGLEKQRQNAWNNYIKSIRGGNAKAAETHGTIYYNVYRTIAKTIGMNEAAAVDLGSMEKVKALQAERLNLILKGRTTLTPQQVSFLAIKDSNDWQDVVYQAIVDMEEVQWGGLDACFFMAAANLMQAYYHLGQYEKALTVYRKNKDLFKQCDVEYKKNNEPIENSPTADARMWEGYNCYALAKKLEPKDKQNAIKYYKRAFVAFGQLLMNYPKHRDGAKNYPVLLEIVDKLKVLEPAKANGLDTQLARVPKPELKASASAQTEMEELVPPLPAQQFKDGNTLAAENMQKDRTPNKSTDADWQKCREHFAVVDSELTPIMQGKRLSTGLPKVLNHLLISNGYLGNLFKFRTLVNLGEFMYRDNDLVHHGIAVGANALWMYAERYEAAGAKDIARRLQDETMKVYEIFLRIAPSHPYAPNVAIRLASVEFIRANELGLKINEMEKKGAPVEEIAKVRKEWVAGFDRALARFEFIFNNFSNRKEFLDKSYELAIEAYRLTNRLTEAADMCDRFCESDSDDALKLLKAKIDTASNLYKHIQDNIRKENKKLQAEIALIKDPMKPAELPAETLEIIKKADEKAAKNTADAGAAPKKEDPEVEAARAAKVEYDNAMAAYQAELEKFKPQAEKREKLRAQIKANEAKIPEISRRAIKAINEMRSWLTAGSAFQTKLNAQLKAEYESKVKAAKTDAQKQALHQQIATDAKNKLAKEVYRADTIMPWLCEDAGDIDNSIKEFLNAANKYGASELEKENSDPAKEYKTFAPGYLMKAGMLYSSVGKDEDAQKIFEQLTREYPNKPEGKNVQYFFAMSLYKSHKYELSLKKFYDILQDPTLKETLTVGSYRQIASTLIDCPDKNMQANAAQIALIATEHLLDLLSKDINLKDWIRPEHIDEYASNPERLKQFVESTSKSLNKSKAKASLIIADAVPDKAADYLNKALAAYLAIIPDNMRHKSGDPDYYDILFARADVRFRLGKYDDAAKDLIAAGRRANAGTVNGPYVVGYYYKAQNELGKVYIKQGETQKAHAAFMIIAALNFEKPKKTDVKPDYDKMEPKAKQEAIAAEAGAAALEEAVYMSAKTASDLGDSATAKRMADKYVDYYPNGKFISEARALR